MLIKVPKGWEIPGRETTPEGASHLSRREILLAAGIPRSRKPLSGLPPEGKIPTLPREIPNSFWTGPSRRNRPPPATTISTNSTAPTRRRQRNLVGKFVTRPWTVEITGLVNKPQTRRR